MLRAWRGAVVAAVVAGTAIAAQLTVIAPAQAAAPTITIAAKSELKPVTGDVFVVYHVSAVSSAKLAGTVTGGAAGEVAALYAQPFPYKKAGVRVASITLKAAKTAYSFTVKPTLATHYAVKLFASGTATAPVASSSARAIYVASEQTIDAGNQCGRPVCHETFHIYTFVPASALKVEMAKHLYPYFGLNLSATRTPGPPKWLYLNAGHPTVSKPRRISAGEFENTLKFSFTIGNDGAYFIPGFCTKDAESSDGLGLPGRHGCGASKLLSASTAYLG
jgi:hypothetical protein